MQRSYNLCLDKLGVSNGRFQKGVENSSLVFEDGNTGNVGVDGGWVGQVRKSETLCG